MGASAIGGRRACRRGCGRAARSSTTSSLPPEDAVRRLAGAVQPRSVRTYLGFANGLVGWVRGDRFRFTIRFPMFNNSFEPFFQGVIEPAPTGSRIRGRLGMHPLVLVFILVWIVFATALSLPAAISGFANPGAWQPSAPSSLATILFPVFGVALWVFGRLIASLRERRLIRRLDELFGISVAAELA